MENNNEYFLQQLELELLKSPEFRDVANQFFLDHSHENIGENQMCAVCSMLESVRSLISISNWLTNAEDGIDLGNIIIMVVRSISDLSTLSAYCAQAATTLNLLSMKASMMAVEALEKEARENG